MNAVARGKEPLQVELNAANERVATAESRAANVNNALTEARQRATTAEAALEKAQSSHNDMKQKATHEGQRASDNYKAATDEYTRAEKAEDEVRKYKAGKASQDLRIRGYLDDISRLKKLIDRSSATSDNGQSYFRKGPELA